MQTSKYKNYKKLRYLYRQYRQYPICYPSDVADLFLIILIPFTSFFFWYEWYRLHPVIRLQTSILSCLMMYLTYTTSCISPYLIQQTRHTKEVTHNKGFEWCWITVDYRIRLLHVYNKAILIWMFDKIEKI